jgi:hypothetical protein
MPQETIENIEEKIRSNDSLSEENKAGLLNRIAELKTETEKEDKNPSLIKSAFDSLSDYVKKFEVTHPVLVEDINYAASVLANMGI